MAICREVKRNALNEWLATQPAIIKELCLRLPIGRLYSFRGMKGEIQAYNEDGTVTMVFTGEWCEVAYPHKEYNLNPSEVIACDLPLPSDPVGAKFEGVSEWFDGMVENVEKYTQRRHLMGKKRIDSIRCEVDRIREILEQDINLKR